MYPPLILITISGEEPAIGESRLRLVSGGISSKIIRVSYRLSDSKYLLIIIEQMLTKGKKRKKEKGIKEGGIKEIKVNKKDS